MSTNPRPIVAVMAAGAIIAAALLTTHFGDSTTAVAAASTPAPSPTTAPTPYMPLEEIPNGNWDVIEQGYASIEYSRMVLREVGNTVTGTWYVDNKTTYVLDGARDGSHLTLSIKAGAKPDAKAAAPKKK